MAKQKKRQFKTLTVVPKQDFTVTIEGQRFDAKKEVPLALPDPGWEQVKKLVTKQGGGAK